MKKIVFLLFLIAASCSAFGQGGIYQIIPQPAELFIAKGIFEINNETKIYVNGPCRPEAQFFVDWLNAATGKKFVLQDADGHLNTNFIYFSTNSDVSKAHDVKMPKLPGDLSLIKFDQGFGEYKIAVDPRGIMVSANFNAGMFYGVQTLRQMLPVSAESGLLKLPYQLTAARITDKPAFIHRGMLLDCSRHFMTKDFVKKYIDLLAYYKMNVLHWHLTEDQGWRIEIEKYPLLTEVGAWRTEADGSRYGGFYTKKDIREIVAYANSRHVTIIPEIELPGHSSAAIAAYPELSCTGEKINVQTEWGVFKDIYCAGNDSTFTFLENVLTEVCELFPGKYIHIGGDEAPKFRWEHCEKCQKRMKDNKLKNENELQSYFIKRIAKFLEGKGKTIIGWDEILDGEIPSDAVVQSWRGMAGGLTAAKMGHDVVMSPTSHCYFDYDLDAIDVKKVFGFEVVPIGLTPLESTHVIGGECNMWTEHAPQELVDSKVFPRLLAFSEMMWTFSENRNFDEFNLRLTTHYDRLKAMKVDYGFPAVPAILKASLNADGKMQVDIERNLSDTKILYHFILRNGKSVAEASDVYVNYEKPIEITGPTTIEARVYYKDKIYSKNLIRSFDPHKAAGKEIKLANKPSDFYMASGMNALIDGCIGSENFRDGIWQAVQGADMIAVIDLGTTQEITSISTNWFHYGNAWVFRPSHLEYQWSNDGIEWKKLADVLPGIAETEKGEIIVPMRSTFPKQSAQFIRMIAHNNGPCPAWHDAPGEPSWLFCDEIVVK